MADLERLKTCDFCDLSGLKAVTLKGLWFGHVVLVFLTVFLYRGISIVTGLLTKQADFFIRTFFLEQVGLEPVLLIYDIV